MLEIKGVTKKYGSVRANDDISFSAEKGEIALLLGPNGAGKSTLIKCITGLLRYEGEVKIGSYNNKELKAKALLGYVPEMPAVYDMLTVSEHLEFILRAYKTGDDGTAEKLLKAFELEDKKDKLGKELSKGMQQKLSICCALVHRPEVIIFDEPMVGLDPHAIKELKNIITQLKKGGACILISTHMIDSVGDLWDTAYIMDKGRLKAMARKDEMSSSLDELFFSVTEKGDEI